MRYKEILEKLNNYNDGTRTLLESIPVPEVELAFKDFIKSNINGIVIGGCAVDFYIRPRSTMDIDILFLSKNQVPNEIPGFKKIRTNAFQHNKTHVEVEIVYPELINISKELVQKVIDTAEEHDGIKVASPTGLVALKLQRLKRYDVGDILELYQYYNIDFTGWPIMDNDKNRFNELITNFL